MFQRRRRTAAPMPRLDPTYKSECNCQAPHYACQIPTNKRLQCYNIYFSCAKKPLLALSTRLHYRRTAQSPLPWSSAGGNNPAFPFAGGGPFCPCCSRCSLRILSTILVRMYNKAEITRHSRINRTVSPNSSIATTSSRSRPRTAPSK